MKQSDNFKGSNRENISLFIQIIKLSETEKNLINLSVYLSSRNDINRQKIELLIFCCLHAGYRSALMPRNII